MPGFRRNSKSRRRVGVIFESKSYIIIASLAIISIIVSIILINIQKEQHKIEIAKKQEEINSIMYELYNSKITESETVSVKIPDKVINVISVGDILCETGILEATFNSETGEYNFYNIFEDVEKYIYSGDITLATLETNFVNDEEYKGKTQYNSPRELISIIKELGIDVVNTATNHSLDYGIKGVEDTINNLKNEGLDVVGTNISKEDKNSILIKEIKGIKIAFLSYTYGVTRNANIINEASYVLNVIEKERIINDIKLSKENGADFTFVLMHWGDLKSSVQNKEQIELANILFENGADFILGSHPASIQPMEVRENAEGKNIFIAYSVGNLLSSIKYNNSQIEMILDIEITKNGESGETYLSSVTYTPIYLLDRGKSAENRYKLLDVKKEIELYENGKTDRITEEEYESILNALLEINNLVGRKEE